MSSFVKDIILKNHSITEYLTGRGIKPVATSSDRFRYRCPFHTEKDGSFFVYRKDDHEDYHCYGCKAHGDIITLVAKIEGLPYKDVVTRLSDGLKIDNEAAIDSLVREIIIQQNEPFADIDPLEFSFVMSDMCYRFLAKVNFDAVELELCEKLFKKIDELVYAHRTADLNDLQKSLPAALAFRYNEYLKRKEKRDIEEFESSQKYRSIA